MSSTENYERDRAIGAVTERTVEQVPWCLTSYDSKGPMVAIDREMVRQTLSSTRTIPGTEQQAQQQDISVLNDIAKRRQVGYFRSAGIEHISRTWWDFFTLQPHKTLVNHILPVLTKCSMIGTITLNTDGDYLLTAHPKYGFSLFSDIAFVPMAAAHRASALYWEQMASRCGILRSSFVCGFVLSLGLCVFSKYRPGVLSRAVRPYLPRYGDQGGSERAVPSPSTPSPRPPGNVSCSDNSHTSRSSITIGHLFTSSPTSNIHMCVICLSEARTVLVRPCLHLCLCLACYRDNYDNANNTGPSAIENTRECPICRDAIESCEVIYNP